MRRTGKQLKRRDKAMTKIASQGSAQFLSLSQYTIAEWQTIMVLQDHHHRFLVAALLIRTAPRSLSVACRGRPRKNRCDGISNSTDQLSPLKSCATGIREVRTVVVAVELLYSIDRLFFLYFNFYPAYKTKLMYSSSTHRSSRFCLCRLCGCSYNRFSHG